MQNLKRGEKLLARKIHSVARTTGLAHEVTHTVGHTYGQIREVTLTVCVHTVCTEVILHALYMRMPCMSQLWHGQRVWVVIWAVI